MINIECVLASSILQLSYLLIGQALTLQTCPLPPGSPISKYDNCRMDSAYTTFYHSIHLSLPGQQAVNQNILKQKQPRIAEWLSGGHKTTYTKYCALIG